MALVYNNRATDLRDRLKSLFRLGAEYKGQGTSPLPVVRDYVLPQAAWTERTFGTFVDHGYRLNAAVYACSRTLARAFSEPPLMCYEDETKKKSIPNHPLRRLMRRPNEVMGEDEFWQYVMTYAPIGGNCYGYMVPTNGTNGVGEIWPYHDGVMWPVPRGNRWVDHYEYSLDGYNTTAIPSNLITHFKFSIDPKYPWKGMSAMRAIARQVDTDNELTRYVKALLQNDAVPRTVVTVPQGSVITKTAKQQLKLDFAKQFGGDNRGSVAILEGGGTISRMSMNMNELAFDALHGIPQADIAAGFGVPAILAGLKVGLEEGREGNWESTRRQFTEQTLVPLWKAVAGEWQASVVPFFGNDCYVDFDLTQVRALVENNESRVTRVRNGYLDGSVAINEYRAELGKDPIKDGDTLYINRGRPGFSLVPLAELGDYIAEHGAIPIAISGKLAETQQAVSAEEADTVPAPTPAAPVGNGVHA